MDEGKKTVFIIGASSGIGRATAELFLSKGYEVYNGARSPLINKQVKNLILDVADPGSICNAIDHIVSQSQRLDILIYSAGFSMAAPFETTLEDDFRYLFDVNFFGFAKAIQCILPHMREHGEGHIIAVSSMAAAVPLPFDGFYSASKAALNMLVRCVAKELEPYNIKVSSVMPGGTATDFTAKRKYYPHASNVPYESETLKHATEVAASEQSGDSPETVAQTILSVAQAKNPPLLVPVGLTNKMRNAALKFMG